jgi:hypothetical protein
MKIFEPVLVDKIVGMICDVCGHKDEHDELGANIIPIKHDCGYFTKEFEDSDTIELDICISCLKKEFGKFIKVHQYGN